MKFKFVKKGKEISSEQVGQFMNFEQVVDKAAGIGSAPLAKAGLASKSAFVTKALWVAAIPFTAAVYLTVSEFVLDKPEEVLPQQEETVQISEESVPAIIDSVAQEPEPVEEEAASPAKATNTSAPKKEKTLTETAEKTKEPEIEEEPEEILIKEDIMIKAEPVGGFPAFYETIDKELTYPESARISNIEGFVRVYFVVDKDGKAGDFQVVRSLGDDFDEEALRVMKKLTDWKPATHNGQPVSQHLSIKLRFELEKK